VPRLVAVASVEQLTPRMTRIVFGGEGLKGFDAGAFTDHYVKLQFPPPDADYRSPFDVEEIRSSRPREHWPRTRTYTVREWEPRERLLTIDFVVHGEDGIAGPWARRARVGDTLQLVGPAGAYAPDPDAAWHLMAGDASVLPAISASLPRVPEGRPVRVLVQVDDRDDELPLATPGELRVQWLHDRGDEVLAEAITALEFPPGPVQAFVHGEASSVRAIRRHLIAERGLSPESLSVSGYWKRWRTDEGWREDKAEWKRLVEADVA
jgi:NADPH-dependent ferric siderophore reductase